MLKVLGKSVCLALHLVEMDTDPAKHFFLSDPIV
jgi:hypothetical protein